MDEAGKIEVSVVIPVLNGAATIEDQLAALAEQTFSGSWEVVVADNGSTDGTPSVVEGWTERLPGLRIVDASDRRGRDHACNVGVQHARGDVVLFCDADDIADAGWIAAMVGGKDTFDLWGGPLDVRRLNDPEGPTWRPVDPDFATSLHHANLRFLPFAPGCNMGAIRDRLTEIGGFDESLVGNCEDLEISWRAQLAGLRIGFVPGGVMFFRYRSSVPAVLIQQYGYAVAIPQVYRRFRSRGMPRDGLRKVLHDWAWLAVRLPMIPFDSGGRSAWARVAGRRAGRLVGSLRHRVVFL